MKYSALFVSAVLLSGSVSAADLLVTESNSKAGVVASLDVVSDGNVSVFDFFLNTGKINPSGVDCSKCFADLPKGFTGSFKAHESGVQFVVMADGMTALPAGVVSLGQISFKTSAKIQPGSLAIERLEMSDVAGNVVQSNSRVAE